MVGAVFFILRRHGAVRVRSLVPSFALQTAASCTSDCCPLRCARSHIRGKARRDLQAKRVRADGAGVTSVRVERTCEEAHDPIAANGRTVDIDEERRRQLPPAGEVDATDIPQPKRQTQLV